jgi:2-methylcitrate dehydratase PrpD
MTSFTFAREKSVSRLMAELAIETPSSEISDIARKKAKMSLIDIIGNAMAGFDVPGVPAVRQLSLDWGGKPETTVWFSDHQLPSPEAGFVNSVMGHALDLDDYHRASSTHISVVTVPTALVVGELTNATGQELLDAIVLGVEVATRIGEPFKVHRKHIRFLPTSVIGGFGATAIAARLMDLTVEQTIDAYGIFYAHASGNRQALFDRTLTKRIQPGIAVKAGILAAHLAKNGLTGPEHIFLSDAGLLRIYGSAEYPLPDVSEFEKKQESWEIQDLCFKKYAACGAGHPAIEAAIQLANEHNLTLDDIKNIELYGIFVGSGMVDIPWRDAQSPHVLAQFCAPYEVVSAIKNKKFGPEEITNERIAQDKEVDAMARKVIIKHEDKYPGEYPGGQTVRIETQSGETLVASRRTEDLFNPDAMSMADIIQKMKSNAAYSGLCSPEQAEAIVSTIQSFASVEDVADFVREQLVFK